MRKRTIIILTVISAMLLWPSVHINAISEIPLEATYIDPNHDQGDPHRGPVLVPEVSIEGYTLFFGTPCDGSVLRLLDEDGRIHELSRLVGGASDSESSLSQAAHMLREAAERKREL